MATAAGGGLLMLVVAVTAWVSCVGTAAAAEAAPVPTGTYLVQSELGNGLVLDDKHPTQAGSQATVAPLQSYHYAQQWVLEQHDGGYYTMYNRENLWLFLGVDSTDLLAPIVEMQCEYHCGDAPAEKLKWKLEPQTDGTYLDSPWHQRAGDDRSVSAGKRAQGRAGVSVHRLRPAGTALAAPADQPRRSRTPLTTGARCARS